MGNIGTSSKKLQSTFLIAIVNLSGLSSNLIRNLQLEPILE
jgi:hypothetical protein